jgi:hypothetical protein
METFLTMIVTAADAPLARSLAAGIDPAHSSGMWTTALASASAPTVPTHYISTGFVAEAFAAVLPLATWAFEQPDPEQPGTWTRTAYEPGDAATVAQRAGEADPPIVVTTEEVEALYLASDVTTEDPWVALGRLGLVLAQESAEPVADALTPAPSNE